ncbi:hypothetical protein MMC10_000474 [Thelotrema lepadinum]|nr:hypothetical protein [Thelotrema lepadinum]
MAAAIKAINAKIRSNKVLDYVCSTHFWGPVSNFGIPVAAIMDTQKDPEMFARLNALCCQGGREKALAEQAKSGAAQLKEGGKQVLEDAKGMANQAKANIQK